jgi:hypothetical protein
LILGEKPASKPCFSHAPWGWDGIPISGGKMKKLKLVSISDLRQSKEQEKLYDHPSYSEITQLARSIEKDGLLDAPIITEDNIIISGHRRILACLRLGKKSLRCEVKPIRYRGNRGKFLRLLREANRHRVKKINEVFKEEIIDTTNNEAESELEREIIERSDINIEAMEIEGTKERFGIIGRKPILDAAIKIINELRDYWPLSDRQIHYKMLNDPPEWDRRVEGVMTHFVYMNDKPSYNKLTDVLTRGRISGAIPWEAIGDETRPSAIWRVHSDTSSFIGQQLDRFMKGYFRDCLQSQPNRIEIMGEKLTLVSIIRPVAMKYCIVYTIGRGYSSINPRYDLAVRFKNTGKSKLIILILSDLDPDGDEIAQSFARSMRDDFHVNVYPIKTALTWDQVKAHHLPVSPDRKAKTGSRNYRKYFEKYKTDDVWELEALTPQQLDAILDNTIRSVIDIDLFNREIEIQNEETIELEKYRERAFKTIQDERGNDDKDN